jgi:hypothetical protein
MVENEPEKVDISRNLIVWLEYHHQEIFEEGVKAVIGEEWTIWQEPTTMWKTFVYEATSRGQKDNPIVKLHICRNCGATDNRHDPHVPGMFSHGIDDGSCTRCGKDPQGN